MNINKYQIILLKLILYQIFLIDGSEKFILSQELKISNIKKGLLSNLKICRL